MSEKWKGIFKEAAKIIIYISAGYGTAFCTACTTTHGVMQSAESETFKRGDTTRTTTTITYEQRGKIRK